MSRGGKNSAEVVDFMTLFARLKLFCEDAPDELADQAATDSSVDDLCIQLGSAAGILKTYERRAPPLFAAPVDPAFLAAWRDYEERYESVVSHIWETDLRRELGWPETADEPSQLPKVELQWDKANDAAASQADIEAAIECAQFFAKQDCYSFEETQSIKAGVAAWDRLNQEIGFDLRGVLRRRALIPFVLVPRPVSDKHGSSETLSMLKNLQQAHDAFVYGAPYAALALMRSIMEAVLRDHYRAESKDVIDCIRNARARLPRAPMRPPSIGCASSRTRSYTWIGKRVCPAWTRSVSRRRSSCCSSCCAR